MAKRFIDTGFYQSPFVRGIEAPLKGLYSFIICSCSGAGIWPVDFELANLMLGTKIDPVRAAEVFLKSGKAVDIGGGRWFIPSFIEHQYPSGLQAKNPAHKNFISELQKFGLLNEDLTIRSEGASKPLERPFEGSKVMVTVMDKVEVQVQEKVKREKFSRPDLLEIQNFMDERNVAAGRRWTDTKVEAEAKGFFNYYESNGWKVGRNAMKDWQAAARNWMNNTSKFQNHNGSSTKPETRTDRAAKLAAETFAHVITRNTGHKIIGMEESE